MPSLPNTLKLNTHMPARFLHRYSQAATGKSAGSLHLDAQSLHLYLVCWRCTARPWTALRVTLHRLCCMEACQKGRHQQPIRTQRRRSARHTRAHSAEHAAPLHMWEINLMETLYVQTSGSFLHWHCIFMHFSLHIIIIKMQKDPYCSQSAVRGMSCNDTVWVHKTDISRSRYRL